MKPSFCQTPPEHAHAPTHTLTGKELTPGKSIKSTDVCAQWLFMPPWTHESGCNRPASDLKDTQTNAGVLACLQPADHVVHVDTPGQFSASGAAASPSVGRRSRRGRPASSAGAAAPSVYSPSTFVHFTRTVCLQQAATHSAWAALLRADEMHTARHRLVRLLKLEGSLVRFYPIVGKRYMVEVSLRLQQATLDAQAGVGKHILDVLADEAAQIEHGLFIDTPPDPTALPAFLVPYSASTVGEAAAESGSDSEELEIVEVGEEQAGAGGAGSSAPTTLLLE